MERVDKYGHCVLCGKMLIAERVVDGQVVNMFTPEHTETEFMLNDGSRMRVTICTRCKAKDLSRFQEDVMEAVKNGWQKEVDSFVQGVELPDGKVIKWNKEKAVKHMEEYNKKSILFNSEGLSTHVIEENKERVKRLLQENKKIIDKVQK